MPEPEDPTGRTMGKAVDDPPRVTTPEYVRVDTGFIFVIAYVDAVKSEVVGVDTESEFKSGGEIEADVARDAANMDAVS